MQAVTLDAVPVPETAARDVRRVELAPLPGIEQGADLEKEIQRRIQQESHQLVRDILKRSAGLARPPLSSESARAMLGVCLEGALAATGPSAQSNPIATATATADSSQSNSVRPFRGD